MDKYYSNFEYMLQSPMMKEMKDKLKQLKRENRNLRKVILALADHIPDLDDEPCPLSHIIKKEFTDKNNLPAIVDDDDDDVIIVEPINKPNIIYELIEKEEGVAEAEVEKEEEAAEEEEEDEEEEEEEEAAEEEEEEAAEEEEEEAAEEEEEEETAEEEDAEEEEEEEEAEEEEAEAEEEEAEAEEEEEAAEEEEQEAEEEEVEEQEEAAEEEAEVYEITIKGKKYFTTNEQNGEIYSMDPSGEVGDEVGLFVKGVAIFN
jgi:chemotaxis protein histidine kinase CheA